MNANKSQKGIFYTMAGTAVGLGASMGVYLLAALLWGVPATTANAGSFGIAGLIMGGYFGYVLSHFNYDALYRHTDKKA